MGDNISRQAAIDIIENVPYDWSNITERTAMVNRFKSLPSAEPKTGKWVHHDGGYSDHYECTACGTPIVLTERWKFCPHCGADMRGEQDDE